MRKASLCLGIFLLSLISHVVLSAPAFADSSLSRTISNRSMTCDATAIDWKAANIAGFHHYKAGDYDLAMRCYKRSIEINPHFAIVHNNLGVLLLKTSKLKLAEKHFRKACTLDPSYVKAILNLAVTNYRLGKKAKAKKLFSKAESLDRNYVAQRVTNYKRALWLP